MVVNFWWTFGGKMCYHKRFLSGLLNFDINVFLVGFINGIMGGEFIGFGGGFVGGGMARFMWCIM
jgi:hypothetical protein